MLDLQSCLRLLALQSLALSLGLLLVLALRGFVLRRFGAGVAYRAWVLPLLMVVAAGLPAPQPAQALRAQVLTRIEAVAGVAPPTLPLTEQAAWPWVLLALWGFGFVLCTARLVWLLWRYMRVLQRVGDGWQGPSGSGPALVGLLRPRLVLPADFEQRFDARQQVLVLAHEAVHRQRADNHWNALAATLCLLHWFNPLAWLALRCMRVDQELACDAAVMAQHPGSEAPYARALLLAQNPVSPLASPVWASWQSAHPLVERIEMLKNPPAGARRRVLGYAMLACLSMTGVALAQAVVANDEPKPDIQLQLDLTIEEALDSGRDSHRVKTTLRLASGKHFTLRGTPTPPVPNQPPQPANGRESTKPPLTPHTEIEIWADDLRDGRVAISAAIGRGEPLKTIARPSLITHWGDTARLEIGPDAARNKMKLSLSVTPTQLKPPKT